MENQKKSKIEIQKNQLKEIFIKMLETNISVLEFQKTMTQKDNEKKGIDSWIKKSKQGISVIKNVKHYEILVSLYNTYMNGKEPYYILLCNSITSEDTIKKWDKTEEDFKEFLKQEEEARKQCEEETKEKKENAEFIKKAKADGKKVEMMFKDGKLKPVLVEEKAN